MSAVDHAAHILVYHQRRDIGSCLCGWAELGRSHSAHQANVLSDAGLLTADPDPRWCTAVTRSWDHFVPQQVDNYWITCDLSGPHDQHEDSHTGLTWTDQDQGDSETYEAPGGAS